jgi:Fic family protein
MSNPLKQMRKPLADLFQTLAINSSTSASASTNLFTINIAKSLRETMGKKFPHWGSRHGKDMRATFTITMDAHYDYYSLAKIDEDPDDLFEKTHGFFEEIQAMVTTLTDQQAAAYDSYTTEALSAMIFASNYIEKVGATHDITLKICRDIFAGIQVPLEIPEHDKEYAKIREFLITQNKKSDHEAIVRTRREIVQHAYALKFIIRHVVVYNESLSEDLILKTHKILCNGIDLEEGDDSSTYAGIYRKVNVRAGFSTFTPPEMVPGAIKSLVKGFDSDILKAEDEGELDPFALAAKYCHKFVNIHPFVDGNGRTCRFILNAILLKYAGIIVSLGGDEHDREEYLMVACRASEIEQLDEEEHGGKPAWAELSSLVIKESCKTFKTLRNELRGKA